MRFFGSGNFYPYLPEAIRTLPFNLLRSADTTRDPEVIRQGIEEYGYPLPVMVPQRMAFSKWKTPPTVVGFGQNALSLIAALGAQGAVISEATAHAAQRPFLSPVEAKQRVGADRMPQPTDNLDPNLHRDYVPLAQDAVPLDKMVESTQIQAFVDTTMAEHVGNDARASALDEVQQAQEAVAMMTRDSIDLPWFMRTR